MTIQPSIQQVLCIVLIVALGAFLRMYNVNWDSGYHLHPDERFLTIVTLDMQFDQSISDYLDPYASQLNPHNIGHDFFVYGSFPLVVTKLVASLMDKLEYHHLTLLGRHLSAMLDVGVLLLVGVLSWMATKLWQLPKQLVLWSMLLYALAVLPIQLSHFYTTDVFMSFFSISALTTSLLYYVSKRKRWLVLSSICLAIAVSSKISVMLLVPLIAGIVLLANMPKQVQKKTMSIGLFRTLLMGAMMALISYVTLRCVGPNLFESSNWLHPIPNQRFVANLQQLKSWESPDVWFPPAIQWISAPPFWFALTNMAAYGFGWVSFLVIVAGFVGVWVVSLVRRVSHRSLLWLLLLWISAFFVYQSTQFVKALRYFLLLYPILAVIGGVAIALGLQQMSKQLRWIATPLVVLLLAIWPAAFMSVYVHPHSRVQASAWIYEYLPASNRVVNEHWDDPLPLLLPNQRKAFHGEQAPVFAQDTNQKWMEMELLLDRADYYFITSKRTWLQIMKVPEKYPRQAQFYRDLFTNQTDFRLVAEFTSYPSLAYLGIPITFNDDFADETFTVYDHPKVMLFVNTKRIPLQ